MRIITLPNEEALLPLDVLRTHCRIDGGDDDALLEIWRSAARAYVEHYTGTSIGTQQREIARASWPDAAGIALPAGPVHSLDAVQYIAADGTVGTLPVTDYYLDQYRSPHRWMPAPGVTLPALQAHPLAVRIRYSSGAATPPAAALQAMLLLVDHADKNRAAVAGGNFTSVPFGVDALLDTLTDYTGRGG